MICFTTTSGSKYVVKMGKADGLADGIGIISGGRFKDNELYLPDTLLGEGVRFSGVFTNSENNIRQGIAGKSMHTSPIASIHSFGLGQNSKVAEQVYQDVRDISADMVQLNDDVITDKYRLTDKVKYLAFDANGHELVIPLYQIEALRDFGDVKAGDKGGFIQSIDNLSQNGDAWVYSGGHVMNNAVVNGNGRVISGLVKDEAIVKGVVDKGYISGHAYLGDKCVVKGGSITGNSLIDGRVVSVNSVLNDHTVNGCAYLKNVTAPCAGIIQGTGVVVDEMVVNNAYTFNNCINYVHNEDDLDKLYAAFCNYDIRSVQDVHTIMANDMTKAREVRYQQASNMVSDIADNYESKDVSLG